VFGVGQRQGRIDKVFALLLIIILIGIIQDRIFVWLDKEFFPHKYQQENKYVTIDDQKGIHEMIWDFIQSISGYLFIGIYLFALVAEFTPIAGGKGILSYFFADTAWVIHFVAWIVIAYKGYRFYYDRQYPYLKKGVQS